ncbi:hypothetical protein SMICM17S_11761 [Streptomyces microflavus]
MEVVDPVEVPLLHLLRVDLDLAVADRVTGGLGERGDLDPPLEGEAQLDGGLAAQWPTEWTYGRFSATIRPSARRAATMAERASRRPRPSKGPGTVLHRTPPGEDDVEGSNGNKVSLVGSPKDVKPAGFDGALMRCQDIKTINEKADGTLAKGPTEVITPVCIWADYSTVGMVVAVDVGGALTGKGIPQDDVAALAAKLYNTSRTKISRLNPEGAPTGRPVGAPSAYATVLPLRGLLVAAAAVVLADRARLARNQRRVDVDKWTPRKIRAPRRASRTGRTHAHPARCAPRSAGRHSGCPPAGRCRGRSRRRRGSCSCGCSPSWWRSVGWGSRRTRGVRKVLPVRWEPDQAPVPPPPGMPDATVMISSMRP